MIELIESEIIYVFSPIIRANQVNISNKADSLYTDLTFVKKDSTQTAIVYTQNESDSLFVKKDSTQTAIVYTQNESDSLFVKKDSTQTAIVYRKAEVDSMFSILNARIDSLVSLH